MLTGLHFLLTYRCTHQCDHCFLSCSPKARGTFTLARIRQVLEQADLVGTVETIYFEGGEPFLYYALLNAGLTEASARGYETGIVTNAFWAESVEDASLALEPLAKAGLKQLAVSSDRFHCGEEDEQLAENAVTAAKALGVDAFVISIPHPKDAEGVRFRGRAESLAAGLPTHPVESFTECPDEDLASPGRVHLDAFGNVHLCQGLLMGDFLETPLSVLVRDYQASVHPICAPLLAGGPAELAKKLNESPAADPVSACHLCFQIRRQVRDRFPGLLGPPGVY